MHKTLKKAAFALCALGAMAAAGPVQAYISPPTNEPGGKGTWGLSSSGGETCFSSTCGSRNICC